MTAKARHSRPSGPLRRVLVVDDDEETRSVLSGYLGGIGYASQFATNGGRALDSLRAGALPDVVVCGHWKSGLTVARFIERLRRDPATNGLPLLRMTPERSDTAIGGPFRLLELGDRLVRLQDPRR